MTEYGQMIGGVGNRLSDINIYNFFAYYFNNPPMKKIKTVNNQHMYACRIPSLLAKDKKYVIATVNVDMAPHGEVVTLDQIEWFSLQTRTMDDQYNVPLHNYTEKFDEISQSKIRVVEKTNSMFKYKSERLESLIVHLLFSKNQTRNFSDVGTLKIAIETYNTLFCIE